MGFLGLKLVFGQLNFIFAKLFFFRFFSIKQKHIRVIRGREYLGDIYWTYEDI